MAAPKLLLEDGSGGYQLEDGSGDITLDLAGRSAALSQTQAAQTLAAAVAVAVAGALAKTELNDTESGGGTDRVSGVLSVSQAAQTVVAAGTVAVQAALAITEAPDLIAATGTSAATPAASLPPEGGGEWAPWMLPPSRWPTKPPQRPEPEPERVIWTVHASARLRSPSHTVNGRGTPSAKRRRRKLRIAARGRPQGLRARASVICTAWRAKLYVRAPRFKASARAIPHSDARGQLQAHPMSLWCGKARVAVRARARVQPFGAWVKAAGRVDWSDEIAREDAVIEAALLLEDVA